MSSRFTKGFTFKNEVFSSVTIFGFANINCLVWVALTRESSISSSIVLSLIFIACLKYGWKTSTFVWTLVSTRYASSSEVESSPWLAYMSSLRFLSRLCVLDKVTDLNLKTASFITTGNLRVSILISNRHPCRSLNHTVAKVSSSLCIRVTLPRISKSLDVL